MAWILYTHIYELLFAYLFAFGIVFCMLNVKRSKRVIVILVIMCITGSLDELFGIPVRYMLEEKWLQAFFMEVLTLGIVLLYGQLNKRNIINAKVLIGWIRDRIIILILFFIVILLLAIGGLSHANKYMYSDSFQGFVDVVCIAAFMGMISVIIFIIYIKSVNERMEKVVLVEHELKVMQEKYYKELLSREDDTRKYRHDMHNHLLCLREYAKKGQLEDVEKYIEELQNKIFNIQHKCFLTGNHILDILLNNYLLPLKETEICVQGMCNDDIAISDVDFCIIVSNLIQNAVEEIHRQKERQKYIKVYIRQGKEYCTIEVKNSLCLVTQNEKIVIGETCKRDKRNHGIGLKNVQETVEKNGGVFKAEKKRQEFFVSVSLKMKS